MTPKGWALDYVENQYEEDYGGYGLIAYQIEDYIIYDREDVCEDYSCRIFGITFVNASGKTVSYTVFIAYELTPFQMYFGSDNLKESQIYEIDYEEVN